MDMPIRFPSERDKIFEEAQAFRRLTSDERLRSIFDLIASGFLLMRESPHRDTMLALQDAYEEQWQRAQKELFARHGV